MHCPFFDACLKWMKPATPLWYQRQTVAIEKQSPYVKHEHRVCSLAFNVWNKQVFIFSSSSEGRFNFHVQNHLKSLWFYKHHVTLFHTNICFVRTVKPQLCSQSKTCGNNQHNLSDWNTKQWTCVLEMAQTCIFVYCITFWSLCRMYWTELMATASREDDSTLKCKLWIYLLKCAFHLKFKSCYWKGINFLQCFGILRYQDCIFWVFANNFTIHIHN